MKWLRRKSDRAAAAAAAAATQQVDLAQAPQPVVVGHIELALQLPNGASAKVIFYALAGQSREHISQNLDSFREILLRQRTIFEIPQIEVALVAKRKTYEDIRKIQANLGEKERQGKRLSSQEQLQLDSAPSTLQAMEKEIREGEERLAQMRKEAA